MGKTRKTALIFDVAKASGVSIATVSQALGNGSRPVSPATRERVLQAARHLNYHPNASARNLVRQRTNTIGLVFLHQQRPIHTSSASFGLMLDGIMEKATERHQDTLMCTSYSWSDEHDHLSPLLDRRSDGLILVVPIRDHPVIPALQEHGMPFVLLAGRSSDPDVSLVDTNNEAGARLLVRHLLGQGHRRIAFVHMQGQERFSYCLGRLAGYRRAHAEQAVECDPALTIAVEPGADPAGALMRLPVGQRPTAIFGVSDDVALELIASLQGGGWRVPDDMSVVGYDDISSAVRSVPGLTTVRQPLKEIGARCVEVVLDQIDGQAAPGQKIILPTELVLRGSAAPPSAK